MSLIKKVKVIDKGTIDLKQERFAVTANMQAPVNASPVMEMEEPAEPHEQTMVRDVDEAYLKAEEILAEAGQRAEEIMSAANSEAEDITSRAREEGLELGRSEGQEQVAEQMSQAMETLNDAVKERRRIIKDAESELVRLSTKIAEQVIRSEVTTNKDVVMNIVAEAISRVSDRESVIIKVNREDLDHIKQYKDRISGIVDGIKNLSILEDSQVEAGGCVIETNLGYVDARISTKISLIETALKKAESSASE